MARAKPAFAAAFLMVFAGCARPSDSAITRLLHQAQTAQHAAACDRAMPAFLEVIRFAPRKESDDRLVAALVGLAQCEEGRTAYHLAEVHATQAIALRPDDYQLYELRSDILLNASHHDEAVADELRALRDVPPNGKLYEAIGITFADMGEVNDAILALDKAARVSSDKANLELEEGEDLLTAGRYGAAVDKLAWCARTYPERWVRVNAQYFIADAYLRAGEPTMARHAISSALPDAVKVWKYDLLAAKIADANASPGTELMFARRSVADAADMDERAKAHLEQGQAELELSEFKKAEADYRWVAARGPAPEDRSAALDVLGRLGDPSSRI